MTVFDRGDIVRVELGAAQGTGVQSVQRLALVLTTADFNQLGEAIVAAITLDGDIARYAGFAVQLGQVEADTVGVVLVNRIQSLDLQACNAQQVKRVAMDVMDDVMARLMVLFE